MTNNIDTNECKHISWKAFLELKRTTVKSLHSTTSGQVKPHTMSKI